MRRRRRSEGSERSRWGGPPVAFAALLALAGALRLVGIRNGLPWPLLNPDERNIVPRAWAMVHGGGLDPEIFLLSPKSEENGDDPLEWVLDLLPDLPAGKLAIADLDVTSREEVAELERAGVDAVIVGTRDIAGLAGAAPPEV